MNLLFEILRVVRALYVMGNNAIRFVVIGASVWPIAIIFTAVALTSHWAQNLVPVVTLIPLLFLLLLASNRGMAIMIASRFEGGRKALKNFALLIGVELCIGVYFSVIPVNNDPWLVTLLVLSTFALAFLRMACVKGWVTSGLALLVAAITIIFILGGRQKAEWHLTGVKTSFVEGVSTLESQPTPCSTVVRYDFQNTSAESVDVPLIPAQGCWGEVVILPSNWKKFHGTNRSLDGQPTSLQAWCDGHDAPTRVLNDLDVDPHAMDNCDDPKHGFAVRFFARGSGTMTFAEGPMS